ncbi:MAG: enoyl-CoA hydratase/isomerase family protein [Haloarculaceae archaeon]
MSGQIHVDRDGPICTITLENEGKRNALSPDFLPDVREALADCEHEDVRVVVFTGTGENAFSAGYDISEFSDQDESEERDPEFRDTVEAIADYPYPTIAMINGVAVGGAFEFVAACDLRVAVDDARFGITPARLGLVYEGRGVRRVVDVVGPANAKELLFTADLVDADRAKEMGLLNHVVPREDLESTTYDIAETIAGNAPLSLTGTKKIVDAVCDKRAFSDAEDEWAARLSREAFESRDHANAVAAFQAGEDPEFEGR